MTTDDRLAARRIRVAASSLVALVAVVVAATGHAVAGGGIAALPTLVVALLIGVPVGALIVGRRATPARLAIGVAADQAVFHLLFSVFGPESGGAAHAPTEHTEHAQHTALEHVATLGSVTADAALASSAMLGAHLVAAAVAMLVVLGGRSAIERALMTLAREISRATRRSSLAAASERPARAAHPAARRRVVPAARPQTRPLTRRGPPVLV
ncbi:MAG TPA: hypothetical protein VFM95_04600 [Microcella sp.]|nr:hypothetical protein [Microcella sp.]